MVTESLKQYIENSILPMYDDFDAAHRRDHVDMVIEQSMEIAREHDVNLDMVYTIAAYHDTGLIKDRKQHHIISGQIVRDDAWLGDWFDEDEIETIAQAVEDHRASFDHEPRSIYGKIVAEADRFIDPDKIIIRIVQYGLVHYPELDKEGHYKRTVTHMHEKYADGGFMKILSWNVNGLRARLDAVNRIIESINPDIMCFQKVRTKGASMLITIPGYMGWLGPMDDGLFGGVSTYIKDGFNLEFEKQGIPVPEWLLNTACISVLNLDNFFLVNAYFPYANAANEDFIKIRQRWDYEIHDFIVKLSGRKPVVLCGDINIVLEDIYAWDGKSVKNAGCFFPWEHRNFDSLINVTGLIDSYRYLNPGKSEYTYFFQNRPEYRENNQGHRIDYFLVSEEILSNIIQSTILTDITDTDSSPILLEI